MAFLSKFSVFLFGKKESLCRENKIYLSFTLVSLLSLSFAIIWNFNLGLPLLINAVLIVFFLVNISLYFLARIKGFYNSFIFIAVSLIILSISWFLSGGIFGSLPAFFVVAVTGFISVSKSKYHIWVLFLTLMTFFLLIFLEKGILADLVVQYENNETKEADIIFGISSTILIAFLLLSYYKRVYDKEHKELIEQKVELQKLNASKDLFFRIIAHDLRTPFNGILGFTSMMCDKSIELKPEEIQEFAIRAKTSSEKAFNLLESLLEWGRIQQGNLKINFEKINLKQIVEKVVFFYEEKYSIKDIKFEVNISDNYEVFYDPFVFRTILRNLVSNAIKFTPKSGQISICVEAENKESITLGVKDTGIGMSELMLERIFNIEFNSKREGTEGEPSIGLGLVICRELIEKLGGELKVESEVDKGSKFFFSLPKAN